MLLVGADFITRITDYDDKRSAPLFGDAAGAVVLGVDRPAAADNGAIGPIVLRADGSHGATIIATHDERKLHLDGPEVFRHAVARMREVTVEAVARAGLELDDIDLFVYHQANARITKALGERLGCAPERVVDCIETLGNASAATIPVGARGRRARRPAAARCAGAAERLRRRLHLGRRRRQMAGASRWLTRAALGKGCALVTGASRGIGAAIALALAADGWPVGRQLPLRPRRRRARGRADRAGGWPRAVAVAADVVDPAAPDAVFGARRGALRRAGAGARQQRRHQRRQPRAVDARRGVVDSVLDTDLTAAFRFTRRALRSMLRARAGRIVNISSVVGLRANPGQANYAAAKAGLIAFTRTVAVEIARRGVTVNAVAPGLDRDRHDRRGIDRICSKRCRPGGPARRRRSRPACASSSRRRPAT